MDYFRLFVESPLWPLSALSSLGLIALVLTRMSGQKLLDLGLNLLLIWLLMILLGSWIAPTYWLFLGKGLLGFVLLFAGWLALLKVCNRYGNPCPGDGSLAMLLPLSVIPHMMVLSLLGRGLKALIW